MKTCLQFTASALIIFLLCGGGAQAQWSKQVSGTTLRLTDVVMLDSLTAVCVGDSGRILKTTNAGLTWSTKHSGLQQWNAIAFLNSHVGFVVGKRGTIAQTTDRGETWAMFPQAGTGNFLTVAVVGMASIFIGADNGSLMVSHNGGSTWSLIALPYGQIKWLFGQRGDFGPVAMYLVTPTAPYKSTDLGITWLEQPLPIPTWVTLERGTFAPDATAFLVGSDGNPGPFPALYRRRPTDTVWTKFVFMPPTPLCIVRDVSAPSSRVAYACGTNGWMFKTLDGGSFWGLHASGTRRTLNALDLINEHRGVVVGDSGTILFTTNGGSDLNRTPQEFSLLHPVNGDTMPVPRSVSFSWQRATDPDGDSIRYTLILSSDAGRSWRDIGSTSDTSLQVENINLFGPGRYLWTVIASDAQASTPSSEIFVFVVQRTVAVENALPEAPDQFALYQNYPNPFNPSTSIPFSVGGSGFGENGSGFKIQGSSRVTLKVYDVLGRAVVTLVNENLLPGSYEVTFDATGLPSGVYYAQLMTRSFVGTKKMMLIR